jgi:hypothetical protein
MPSEMPVIFSVYDDLPLRKALVIHMVPNQPLLKTGMESLKIGLKARFTTKKYHLSEFHVKDLMEVTSFRGFSHCEALMKKASQKGA